MNATPRPFPPNLESKNKTRFAGSPNPTKNITIYNHCPYMPYIPTHYSGFIAYLAHYSDVL